MISKRYINSPVEQIQSVVDEKSPLKGVVRVQPGEQFRSQKSELEAADSRTKS
jgi:hypothetical protein